MVIIVMDNNSLQVDFDVFTELIGTNSCQKGIKILKQYGFLWSHMVCSKWV